MRENLNVRISRRARRFGLVVCSLAFAVGCVFLRPAVPGEIPIPPAQNVSPPAVPPAQPASTAEPVPTTQLIAVTPRSGLLNKGQRRIPHRLKPVRNDNSKERERLPFYAGGAPALRSMPDKFILGTRRSRSSNRREAG